MLRAIVRRILYPVPGALRACTRRARQPQITMTMSTRGPGILGAGCIVTTSSHSLQPVLQETFSGRRWLAIPRSTSWAKNNRSRPESAVVTLAERDIKSVNALDTTITKAVQGSRR